MAKSSWGNSVSHWTEMETGFLLDVQAQHIIIARNRDTVALFMIWNEDKMLS
jgi:hypothetical protein